MIQSLLQNSHSPRASARDAAELVQEGNRFQRLAAVRQFQVRAPLRCLVYLALRTLHPVALHVSRPDCQTVETVPWI